MPGAKQTTATTIPGLTYHDAPAAIEWLCRAFGFEKHLVVPGEPGEILHSQLRFGNGMVMVGSKRHHGGGLDDYMVTPREVGGRSTQSVYLIVADPAAHFRQASAAGAKIVLPLEDKGYGGSGFTCCDLEGNLWSIGNYDPWADA